MQRGVEEIPTRINASARRVLEELLLGGPLTRAELSRRLALSPASLTRITRPFLDTGYLREGASIPSRALAGRPSRPLDLREDSAHFIGIKLTGESLFAVLTNIRGRVLRSSDSYLLDQDVGAVVGQIVEAVSLLGAAERVVGIGISLSGSASRSDPTVRKSPFLHWHDVPLASMVTERTGLPAVLENDVRALTAAEHWFGAGASLESFAVLTFGAGIGCGMVVNGAQIEGRLGASGLIGHLPVQDHGPLCYAGHRGCAHAFATSAGLARTVSAGLGVSLLNFEECVELAVQGDPVARTAFEEAGWAIGHLIATVVNIIGPEKVLISGEGVQMYELGEDAARRRLGELLHWTASEPEIVVRALDFNDWARGAAVVAIQQQIRQLTAVQRVGWSVES